MLGRSSSSPFFVFLCFCLTSSLWWTNVVVDARPLVRHIRSTHEFDRLLKKHAKETGLPVIVDFYSDGCGPCRMMAPKFKQLAQRIGQDKAVFVKVDTNAMYELSSRYRVRSLPTFMFFLGGKKVNEFAGAGEAQLIQITEQLVRQSEQDNVKLELESLVEYYKGVDESKELSSIQTVYSKCADLTKSDKCIGAPARQLVRKLKKKYGKEPKTDLCFTDEDRQPGAKKKEKKEESSSSSSTTRSDNTRSRPKQEAASAPKPNLHLASKQELMAELERRLDDEEDERVEEEDDDEAEFEHGWSPGDFPERVTIVGGGPAGMSAAIYAARAGLTPVVVAPPMGGQLEGKGVEVENYPGLHNVTGPAVVAAMRMQAAAYGSLFETDEVIRVDASERPLKVFTNNNVISTHSIIVATGAQSNWLGIPGEFEMRGGGVSSCAVCDGAVYRSKDVVVVGGGDTAMEEALVLARTSKSVKVIHRRDAFRASKVLQKRVMEHPLIKIQWNTTVKEVVGKELEPTAEEEESVDLDNLQKIVTGVIMVDVNTGEESQIACDAMFVAIGHKPATSFLEGVVEFVESRPGYVQTVGHSTHTSVPGIFAAGDVADSVYRQAITSAGSGAAAALDAERWLSEEGLGNEAANLEAELLAEMQGSASARMAYNAYEEHGGRVERAKESVGGEL